MQANPRETRHHKSQRREYVLQVPRFAMVAFASLVFVSGPSVASDNAHNVEADTSLQFVVEIGSRLYTDWHETVRVGMLQPFYLADTDLTARIERFLPDFRVNESGSAINYSDKLANPAVHVVVFGDSATSDSTWAFLNFPPHFSPRSFFTFKLMEVEGYVASPRTGDPASKKEDDDD